MKSTILWGLVGLNAILLFIFVGQFGKPGTASAQIRRNPEYLMIPGQVPGSAPEPVYIIDTTNGILGGMAYDDGRNALQTMQPISLQAVYDAAKGRK